MREKTCLKKKKKKRKKRKSNAGQRNEVSDDKSTSYGV
jgi:hypothetical protein